MLEAPPDKPPRTTIQVILGVLFGILISLGCLFLTIFLGMTISPRRTWLFPLLNAAGLALAGIVAFRLRKESSYALGIVIALSLAFLLNTACGVAYFR
jgi:hypothetical protein